MADPSDATPLWRKIRLRHWIAGGILALILLPVLAFLVANASANHSRVPETLRQEPAFLAEHAADSSPTSSSLATAQDPTDDDFLRALGDQSADRLKELFETRFYSPQRQSEWRPDPVTPEQAAVADEFRPALDRVRALARGKGALRIQPKQGLIWRNLIRLLATEVRSKLKAGQGEAAAAIIHDLALLDARFPSDRKLLPLAIRTDLRRVIAQLSLQWADSFPIAPEQRALLKVDLECMAAEPFQLEWIRREYLRDYRISRQIIVSSLDAPWNSPFYGWNPGPDQFIVWHDLEIPQLDLLLEMGLNAMERKRNAAEMLQTFDRFTQDQVHRTTLTYPERRAQRIPEIPPPSLSGYELPWTSLPDRILDMPLPTIAELNLARLALRPDLKPQDRPADGTIDFKTDPTNPWRDPYSEQPLRVRAVEGALMIYGIGPDLIDQQGGGDDLSVRAPIHKDTGGIVDGTNTDPGS